MLQRYKIRPFRPEDLEEVERINRVFLPENYPGYFFIENYRRFPNSFLVAESADGKVVGYVMCRVESYYVRDYTILLGHVLSIAVSRKHRRKGIGRALMEGAEAGLRGYGSDAVYLEVRLSNAPAIKLYEVMGYEKIGIIPSYYSDGEDAYLMYKMLDDQVDEALIKEILGKRVVRV